ncbi:MAG: sigma 54-interacting transcriptional regulator [Thermodesulfobacteriota bacterium]|nr:sigma 54-interacting transcriptional regulator [Thermodesulfobacteriota bacterium]
MKNKKSSQTDREALLNQSDFFKNLLDHMQIGVIVADADGYIIYINETYARFLDIDAQTQIGKHATEVVANTRLHIVARTGVAEVNYPHEFKEIGFLVHRIPIRENGRVIAVLGLVLFEDARTASRLADKLSVLESKVKLYENELAALRGTRYTFNNIISVSTAMKAVKNEAIHAATNKFPVLITGESGTGKELFAQAIHHAGARKSFPFVRVNCAAIPKDLFESEFFGYQKGAFTGADPRGKPGKFELAHLGTIFLDEIGDLPLEMQPKLLNVLEEKAFERVGGNEVIRSDFRLIAATNQDIQQLMEKNLFRKDLYYRLSVIPLDIPPMKKRRADILPMVEHFFRDHHGGGIDNKFRIDSEAASCLKSHDWPGNARELLNVVEQILVSLKGKTIRQINLPFYVSKKEPPPVMPTHSTLKDYLHEAEKTFITQTLEASGQNKSRAARRLGIHRTLLYRKMKKLGLTD